MIKSWKKLARFYFLDKDRKDYFYQALQKEIECGTNDGLGNTNLLHHVSRTRVDKIQLEHFDRSLIDNINILQKSRLRSFTEKINFAAAIFIKKFKISEFELNGAPNTFKRCLWAIYMQIIKPTLKSINQNSESLIAYPEKYLKEKKIDTDKSNTKLRIFCDYCRQIRIAKREIRQIRGGDEPAVTFVRCTVCYHCKK